jgi:hypothetical protein
VRSLFLRICNVTVRTLLSNIALNLELAQTDLSQLVLGARFPKDVKYTNDLALVRLCQFLFQEPASKAIHLGLKLLTRLSRFISILKVLREKGF